MPELIVPRPAECCTSVAEIVQRTVDSKTVDNCRLEAALKSVRPWHPIPDVGLQIWKHFIFSENMPINDKLRRR